MKWLTALLVTPTILCAGAYGQERNGGGTEKVEANSTPTPSPSTVQLAGEHSPNRLIVKFRAGGEHRITPTAYRLMKERAAPEAAATEPETVKSLLELGRTCGLEKMQHLFFGERVTDPANASEFQRQMVQQLRMKFPARDRRAPGTKLPDLSTYFMLQFDGTKNIQDIKRHYEKSALVEAAHLDPVTRTRQEPNDPFLHSRGSWGQNEDDLWGVKQIGCPKAWETTSGRGIVVAIVDTGLEFDHPDIAANVWVNRGEVAGNQKDDDDNGFVDDVRGWDFFNNDNDALDDSREGHGTHVAGIIAAVGNNNTGIIGVSPEATIMPVKAMGPGGSVEFSTAANGFFYAVANGADVINCSWGPGPSFVIPVAIEDLVRFAHSLGVVVVFAAGNDSRPAAQQSPMNMKEVLTVGASVPSDARMPRSNWGRYLGLLAPGGSLDMPPPEAEPRRSILSLKAESFSNSDNAQKLVIGQRYARLSGTSMAAPHAAGVAALVLAVRPDLTNHDVLQILRSSAKDDSVPGFDQQSGYGRLDAARAVAVAKHKPPTVRLSEPAENAELPLGGGRVSIRGVIGGDRLKHFQLFYSRLDRLTELTPLTQAATQSKSHDLAVWDTSSVPPGCYLIRLVVTDTDGNRFEDLVQVHKAPAGIHRLSDERDFWFATTSGDRVAWAERDTSADPASFRVVVLNLDSQKRTVVATTSADPSPIALSDRHVAYLDRSESEARLQLVDSLTGDTTVVKKFVSLTTPLYLYIAGRRLLWDDPSLESSSLALMAYDIGSGRMTNVSGQSLVDTPHADADRAVWVTEFRNVAVCDLRTGRVRLLTEDGHVYPKASPRVSGDVVVWRQGGVENPDALSKLLYYDLKEDRVRILKDDLPLVQGPELAGNTIIWSDARNGNHDVYAFDLASFQERALTTSPDAELLPQIAARTVLWQRFIRVAAGVEGRYAPQIELYELGVSRP